MTDEVNPNESSREAGSPRHRGKVPAVVGQSPSWLDGLG
jgi:hypothetical protein